MTRNKTWRPAPRTMALLNEPSVDSTDLHENDVKNAIPIPLYLSLMWSAWNSMVVDVKQLEEELLHHWRTNLEPHGVPKPTPVQMNQLICLYANFQKPVKITEIKPWLQEHGLKGSNQARHLGRYGWMVASGFTRYKNGPVLGRLANYYWGSD